MTSSLLRRGKGFIHSQCKLNSLLSTKQSRLLLKSSFNRSFLRFSQNSIEMLVHRIEHVTLEMLGFFLSSFHNGQLYCADQNLGCGVTS